MSTITAKKNKTTQPTTSKWRLVHFEFIAAEARAVCIAGTFNDWRPHVTPMISLGNGRWAMSLSMSPGTYEYCLVVDGEWRPDPQASETIANPFGGLNTVLKVAPPVSPKRFSKVRRAFATSA